MPVDVLFKPPSDRAHVRWGSGHATYVMTPEIDWYSVPEAFWGKVSAICRSHTECLDLNKWFGDENFEPDLPVLLIVPNPSGGALGPVVYQQIAGLGNAPVYELRDQTVAVWEIVTERLARTGTLVDFDSLREMHGMMRREDVDAAIREAFLDRIRRHRASPITDPMRQFKYPNPTKRIVFPEQPAQEWKGESNAAT